MKPLHADAADMFSSNGSEGAFYVWTAQEIGDVLSQEPTTALVKARFGVKEDGNVDPSSDVQGELVKKVNFPPTVHDTIYS